MKPAKVFRKITRDPSYLLTKYFKDSCLLIGIIVLLLTFYRSAQFEFNLGWGLGLSFFSIFNGWFIASCLHNASHNNFKNPLINQIMGTYAGQWVLYGFENFILIHFLHHKYSDEELDPVNPQGMNFFIFLTAPMRYMVKAAKKYLFMVHGNTSTYRKIMLAQTILFNLNLGLRLSIWYLLLGDFLFCTIFIPSFLSIVGIFAHINYSCHEQKENGDVEILNIDHNLYYKLANFITSGGYYHLNHHKNMNLYNPQKLSRKQTQEHSPVRLQA